MNYNTILVSFADKRYTTSLKVLDDATKEFPFSKKLLYTEDNISNDFFKNLRYKIHRRGFGYWKWKSHIVLRTLETMNYGDILVYSDSGVYWNAVAIDRFKEYLGIVEKNGILVFQQPFLEKDWTKGDVLEALGAYNNKNIFMSLQLWAGCFMIRKTPHVVDFVKRWDKICNDQYDLITDKRSVKKNLTGFVENRHDQSVFSILVKQIPHIEISWEEVYNINDSWYSLNLYPIQGRRILNAQRSITKRISRLISLPYRFAIGYYLKYFENMFFANRISW